MVEITEPNEALNDSLKALCRTLEEIDAKHKENFSDEEYCIECPHKNACAEWNAKIICDLNYHNWLEKVKVCRKKEDNEEFCSHCDHRATCEDRIASTTCPTNYEAWIEKVNKCREKEEKSGD